MSKKDQIWTIFFFFFHIYICNPQLMANSGQVYQTCSDRNLGKKPTGNNFPKNIMYQIPDEATLI